MNALLALWIHTFAAFGLAYVIGHAFVSKSFREWLAGEVEYRCDHCGARFADVEHAPEVHENRCPGAKFVSVSSNAFRGLLVALLECPACLGFWIGLASGTIVALAVRFANPWAPAIPPLLAFYTCGSNLLLAKLTRLMP